MNKILVEVSKILQETIKEYLPQISNNELEENGAIFYMNDRNGTLFDYYINKHLSPFMMFYDDNENMGAAKLILDMEGKIDIYLFENKKDEIYKEISTSISASQDEILELAVIMNKIADDQDKWGYSIEDMDSDIEVTKLEIDEFVSHEDDYEVLNELFKTCIITNKIMNENWKVGLMQKLESTEETDSGWFLSAGNESQEYIDDAENLCVVTLKELCDRDPTIIPHLLDKEVGDILIRVSDDEFENDDEGKEIFISKFE